MKLTLIQSCVGCGREVRSTSKRIPVCSPCRLGILVKRATFRGRAWIWFARGAA